MNKNLRLIFLLGCLIILVFVLVEGVLAQGEVGKWRRYVVSLPDSSYSGNPFEIEVDATFTHTSSGTTITLPGYYAGSNTWKIGFMPTKIGEWTYVTSSSDSDLNNKQGSVVAIDSGLPGMLKADPSKPRKWKFTDGPYAIPIALRMEFFTEPATQSEFTAAADFLAENNIHMMETRLLEEYGTYEGGRHDYIFEGSWHNHEFDLDNWNRMEQRMEILTERGLGAHIMFYSDDAGEPGWSAESETEELVIRYTIARLAGYPIVWFNTGIDIGEYRNYQGWYNWFGSEIKSLDPYDHPVSSRHDLDSTAELFVVSGQTFNSRGETFARIGGILDFYNEDNVPLSMDDSWHEESPKGAARNKDYSRHDIRRAFWKCVIAGGAGGLIRGYDGLFHLTDKYDLYNDDDEGFAVQDDLDSRQYLKLISPFIENNLGDTFGSMVQASSLVSNGYALADPARTKILYFLMGRNDEYDSGNGGAITVKLSALSGSYGAAWFNPRTGTETDIGSFVGGTNHVITPPSTDDWVLYVTNIEANCGDGVCEGQETCSSCPDDCECHWLEAEYPDTITPPMQAADDSAASEDRYIHVPNGAGSGGDAAYDVDITVPGDYVLWGRAIAPNGEDNSFFIELDSSGDRLWDVEQGTSWQWDQVSDRDVADPVRFTLSGGSHTIKVKQREDGTMIDKLFLTNSLFYSPSGEGEPAENIIHGCPCTLPEICCDDQCVLPACSQNSECGTDTGCRTYTCSSPGTCTASCSYQDITSCTDGDGCCPPGCSEQNDNDCDSPLCEGLVMLMHMDNNPDYGETSTHVYDFSGNQNDGTIHGATHTTSGMFGGSFDFDGMDDYISVNHDPSIDFADESFSYAFWIKGEGSDVFFDDRILIKGTSSGGCGGGKRYAIRATDDSLNFILDDDTSKSQLYRYFSSYLDGGWHHLAFTRDTSSNEMRVYLDGAQDGITETDTSDDISNSCPLYIAKTSDDIDQKYADIEIDEFAMWNRTLSGQDIQDLFNSWSPITCQRQSIHSCDTNPQDGCVQQREMVWFIDSWKYDSTAYPMREMMEAVSLYYNPGAWCS